MKIRLFFLLVMFVGLMFDSFGQLVRKKDYDAAFALQGGGSLGLLTSFKGGDLSCRPFGGLKMTFPFTRQWFLGGEVNYSALKYCFVSSLLKDGPVDKDNFGGGGDWKMDFDLKELQIPVYVKYMLPCNRASVLFGFYGSYVLDARMSASLVSDVMEQAYAGELETYLWNCGLTIGYEHRIIKHLEVMFRCSAGLKEVTEYKVTSSPLLPLQFSLAISYDILRIGDCGCD